MKVLLLSPYPERLFYTLRSDTVISFQGSPQHWPEDQYDYIVCYGYRHIIREPLLSKYRNKILNLHISYLPWNRGADPNLWSWYDGTPKGVSIHYVDGGLDTGPILAQTAVYIHPRYHTLRSSYELLLHAVEDLFGATWYSLRWPTLSDRLLPPPLIQPPGGSSHKMSDKNEIFKRLPLGWDTPVTEVHS